MHASPTLGLVKTLVQAVEAFLIVSLNAGFIFSLRKYYFKLCASERYKMSLAVIDLVNGVIICASIPSAYTQTFVFGAFLCRLFGCLRSALCVLTFFHLMLISIDRYSKQKRRYNSWQKKIRANFWIVLSWLTVFVIFLPYMKFEATDPSMFNKDTCLCHVKLNKIFAYAITINLIIISPMFLSLFYCQYRILSAAISNTLSYRAREKRLHSLCESFLSEICEFITFLIVLIFQTPAIFYFFFHNDDILKSRPFFFKEYLYSRLFDFTAFLKPIIYLTLDKKFRSRFSFSFHCDSSNRFFYSHRNNR